MADVSHLRCTFFEPNSDCKNGWGFYILKVHDLFCLMIGLTSNFYLVRSASPYDFPNPLTKEARRQARHKTNLKSSIQPQSNQINRNLPTMMLRNIAIAAALCVSSVEGFAFSPVSVSSQVEVDTLFCLKYMSRS